MTKEETTFDGFQQSNTTPVPDILFDELLSVLSGSELKVLLYIIRRTLGFKKPTDAISFSQFEDGIKTKDGKILDLGCGLSRETISSALQSLEEMGCIESQKRKGGVTSYSIRFKSGPVGKTDQSKNPTSQLVGKTESTGRKKPKKVVGKADTQETVLQETVLQQTERTNIDPLVSAPSLEEERTDVPPVVPSVSSIFTAEEETLKAWLASSKIGCNKDANVVKKQLSELLPAISSVEELHKLIEFAAPRIRGEDKTVYLGNLVEDRILKAWLQTQQQEHEHEPAPAHDDQIGMSKAEADDLLYNNILQMYPSFIYGISEQNGRYYIGIAKSEHDWIDIGRPEDWHYLPNADAEIDLALAYSSELAAVV